MRALAELAGHRPLPWQSMVGDVALEVDRRGRPFYREVRVTVPRQSGKTTLVFDVVTERALGWGESQRTVYTAQDRLGARDKWEDYERVLRASPALWAGVDRVRHQNGQEAIFWANGSQFGITSSTEQAGHGLTLDVGVIDEAFAQRDERLVQAFRPAMVTRRNAQLWVISTAGTDESTFLRERVDDGRARVEADERAGVAYFEWSAPDDADIFDPATWWACMPALGHTVDVETIELDAAGMPADEFARAYLNRWIAGGVPAVDLSAWSACAAPDSDAGRGPFAFALDVTPARTAASIAVASSSRSGSGVHVELADHRAGVAWVVERVVELDRQWRPLSWSLDPAGPAGSLLLDLAAAGVAVEAVETRKYAQACGALYDRIVEGTLEHRGQPALDAAVAGARRRALGDAWAWARRGGSDVSPLVAVTLAVHGFAATAGSRGRPQIL